MYFFMFKSVFIWMIDGFFVSLYFNGIKDKFFDVIVVLLGLFIIWVFI